MNIDEKHYHMKFYIKLDIFLKQIHISGTHQVVHNH